MGAQGPAGLPVPHTDAAAEAFRAARMDSLTLIDERDVRKGELGEVERFRIIERVKAVAPLIDKADDRDVRRRRTEHELRVAIALQQPQGLGFLFPGLRNK